MASEPADGEVERCHGWSVSSAEMRERRAVRVNGKAGRRLAHHPVPPGRTAQVGEKFGRISIAFKMTGCVSQNYCRARVGNSRWRCSDPRAMPNRPGSGRGAQLDRAETGACRQIDDDELSAAFGQRQSQDEAIRPGCHRLDARATRNVDRRGCERAGNIRWRAAARHSAGDDRDQSCEPDNEHDAHHDDQDFEPTHIFKVENAGLRMCHMNTCL